jgi:hypothetical protein
MWPFKSKAEQIARLEQAELASIERKNAIKEAIDKERDDNPVFRVGLTNEGRVTLHAYNVVMTKQGVDMMIRMLEAAKVDNEEEWKTAE